MQRLRVKLKMRTLKTDVTIIGAGSAGMALALYLKRAKINFILLEKYVPGGKLNNIPQISNFLGIKSIAGSDLAVNMFDQITALGVDVISEEAKTIRKINDFFEVTTNDSFVNSKIVVLATGVSMKEIKIKGYDELYLRGISSCAVCDGYLYKNKRIAVIGNNEISNIEYNYLKGLTKEIIRIDNKEEKVEEFIGEDHLEKIKTNKNIYDIDGAFIYDKEYVNDYLISSLNLNTKNNHISVDENYMTNVQNVYAIGDAVDKVLYQVVGAINDASIASVNIIKTLR